VISFTAGEIALYSKHEWKAKELAAGTVEKMRQHLREHETPTAKAKVKGERESGAENSALPGACGLE
jgi:hypothetical protein